MHFKEIGLFLQEIRIKMHLKRAEMARLIGISQPAIQKLEQGKTLPSLDTMYEFWIKTGCDPKDIFELMHKIKTSTIDTAVPKDHQPPTSRKIPRTQSRTE